jgi:DNA-binding MltR family transcriptional regulator
MTSKSLRDAIKRPISAKTLYRFVDRNHADFRSFVITTVSFLDAGLERLIKTRMRRLSTRDDDTLFGALGVISGFSAKIRLAYGFGIIGPMTRHDLSVINEIRNVFAHSPHPITLGNDALFARVLTINIITHYTFDKSYLDARNRKYLRNREAALDEAMTTYMFQLLSCKYKRQLMKPAKARQSFLRQ